MRFFRVVERIEELFHDRCLAFVTHRLLVLATHRLAGDDAAIGSPDMFIKSIVSPGRHISFKQRSKVFFVHCM